MICSVEGCERRHYARTYCSLHYERWFRHRDPNVVLRAGGPSGCMPPGPLLAMLREDDSTIAARLGVHRRTVARWRRGGRVANPDRLAVALDSHIDIIWSGT